VFDFLNRRVVSRGRSGALCEFRSVALAVKVSVYEAVLGFELLGPVGDVGTSSLKKEGD
jgi:hypothetical protein